MREQAGRVHRPGTAPENIGHRRHRRKAATDRRQLYRQRIARTFRETLGRGESVLPKELQQNILGYGDKDVL